MFERDARLFSIVQLRRLELIIAPLRIIITVSALWLIYGMFRTLSQVDVSSLYQPTIWLSVALAVAGVVRTGRAFFVGPDHMLFRQAMSAGHFREATRAGGLRTVLPKPTRLFALKLIDVAVVTPVTLILMMLFLAWGHYVMVMFAAEELAPSWLMSAFDWSNALLFVGFIMIGIRRMVVAVHSANEEDFGVARSILSTFKC